MNRSVVAAITLLFAAVPAAAQLQDETLEARYAPALAAGYKALMLCGAIANAEANGATRTPESVARWELTGIQAPMSDHVADLPARIVRSPSGQVTHVAVDWATDLPPRLAAYKGAQKGCSVLPIGTPETALERTQAMSTPHPARAPRAAPKPAQGRAGRDLALAAQKAMDGSAYGAGARTSAVLIRKGGATLLESYAPDFGPDTPQRTFSVAKSITATLVGAAVLRGEADVNASAGLGLSDADPRRAIVIDHLLRMCSGRYTDTPGNRSDPIYYGGASVEEAALDWPLVAPPGSTFRYANNDTLAAVAAIKPTFDRHPPAELFAMLDMSGTVAETDWQGNYVLSSQVWSTAGDLATFGELYLNDGRLPSGERILPEGWASYVSTPSGPQPASGFGYGAGFWLLNKEEGVPPDTFAAVGARGQYVVIVPSRQVVIVRRGEDPVGTRFDITGFTRDVLKALKPE
ncbi:MAG: serine hydrolase domain-containing protein [Erythrobacter sp.]